MEIEQKANNWFDETMDLLESRFSNVIISNDFEKAVSSSVSLVLTYAKSVFCVLKEGEKLPAMALLRSLYQLTSRLTWILIGLDDLDRRDRLERLEKESLKDELKLQDEIQDVFKNDKRETTIETLCEYDNARVKIEQRINELGNRGVKGMPQPLQILKEVFKGVYGQPNEGPDASETIPIAAWTKLHKAVHPDYLILMSTIFTSGDGVLNFNGDIDVDIDVLRYECCVCVHRFLKEIYNFYEFDFHKIDNEFLELGQMIVNK
ncbi:MAG: hypothetical protein FVQ85_17795 [Planctomycetes bacterium]|nr:hypothetical protein [Planctomycetota bacterium]